jgi:beta-lactamase class D
VSREHVALVERLITLDSRNGVVFRGKTGGGVVPGNTTIGWLVGMVERGEQEFVYAMVLTTPGDEFERIAPMRQVLARKLLLRAEALPVEMGTE